MEYVFLAIVSTNLAATIYFGKQLLSREEYRIEFVPIPTEYLGLDLEMESSEQKEVPQPEVVEENKKATPSYSAWENRKNIPWNGEQKRPEPPAPRPEGYGYVK